MAKKAATKKTAKAATKKKATAKKTTAKKTTTAKKKTTKKKATKAKKKVEEGDEESPTKKKKKKAKRKTRSKKDVIIRQRIFWVVYNHAGKLVAKYAFNQKKAAEKRRNELSPEGKPPHFIQKVKEEIVEE